MVWIFLGLFPVWASAAPHTVQDIRMWTAPDHTRLVLDLDSRVDYRLFRLSDPRRVVVDIDNAQGRAATDDLDLPDPVIRRVRTGYPKEGVYRVVVDLKRAVNPKTFQLEPQGPHGHRLVIDLQRRQKADRRVTQALKRTETNERLIAVDAGHGGEDPGAIGPEGVQEKDVVLEVAKRLARALNQHPRMRAFLTRDGDYFVKLRERIRKARQAGADLFISLHADAFRNPHAHGASIYALSRKGASDEAAAWLAERENRADLGGSVDLDQVDANVASVLLDLSQTATISDSLALGEAILARLDNFAPLHRQEVQQAPFVVLKSLDIPSILVETGFISNDAEARKLQRTGYQKRLAQALVRGTEAFLERNWPRSEGLRQAERAPGEYTVRKGDTLWSIAQQHQVSVRRLKEINNLEQATALSVGRELEIP